jgi:nicotinamide-nucleotide amidase
MKPMLERHVAPYLRGRFSPGVRVTRVWRLFGLPESRVDEGLRALFRSSLKTPGLLWGILAQDGMVDVKATAARRQAAEAHGALASMDRILRRRFGTAVFGEGAETLAGAVGAALRRAGKTLAVAESCTGGLLARQITDVPGSSVYFWGGVVCYDNDAKRRLLNVPARTLAKHGAVSRETALAMARGLRRLSRADYVLAVTGIAGPGGGAESKPVGLVHTALAGPRGLRAWEKRFSGERQSIREQAANGALEILRQELLKTKNTI